MALDNAHGPLSTQANRCHWRVADCAAMWHPRGQTCETVSASSLVVIALRLSDRSLLPQASTNLSDSAKIAPCRYQVDPLTS